MIEDFEEFDKIYAEAIRRCNVKLNESKETVALVLKGLRRNMDMFGHALCPCRPRRIALEDPESYSCPCKSLESNIAEKGHCTCKLFVKSD